MSLPAGPFDPAQLQLLVLLLAAVILLALRGTPGARLQQPRILPLADADRAQLVDLLAATLAETRP